MILINQQAPEFEAKDTNGKTIKLSELKGKTIILYFYPRDDTPGCTIEACAFRDDFALFRKKDTVILGVSIDDEKSHKKFTEKYNLPFPLLVDTEHKICDAYGVYGEKSMYGRKYMGINRTTFIINKEGKISHIFEKVQVNGHSKELLDKI